MPQRVEHAGHGAREERRVVGRPDRLDGVAEAREVDGDHPEPPGQRRHRGEEGRLRRAEAVQQHHRMPGAGAQQRDVAQRRLHAADLQPLRLGHPARRGEEADAEVEVVAQLQAAAAERLHAAAQVLGDLPPRVGVGGHPRVGPVAVRRAPAPCDRRRSSRPSRPRPRSAAARRRARRARRRRRGRSGRRGSASRPPRTRAKHAFRDGVTSNVVRLGSTEPRVQQASIRRPCLRYDRIVGRPRST